MTFKLLLVLAVASFSFGAWNTALAARLHLARGGPRPSDAADEPGARAHLRQARFAAALSGALVALAAIAAA